MLNSRKYICIYPPPPHGPLDWISFFPLIRLRSGGSGMSIQAEAEVRFHFGAGGWKRSFNSVLGRQRVFPSSFNFFYVCRRWWTTMFHASHAQKGLCSFIWRRLLSVLSFNWRLAVPLWAPWALEIFPGDCKLQVVVRQHIEYCRWYDDLAEFAGV